MTELISHNFHRLRYGSKLAWCHRKRFCLAIVREKIFVTAIRKQTTLRLNKPLLQLLPMNLLMLCPMGLTPFWVNAAPGFPEASANALQSPGPS